MDIYMIATAMQDSIAFLNLDENKQRLGLTAIIARLYSLKAMGDKASIIENEVAKPSHEVLLAVNELLNEVNQKYSFLTLSEIKLALESGVKGELDDQPTYLTIANLCRWLSIYRWSEARTEAKQLVENQRRITAPTNQLEYGTVESRDDIAMRTLYTQLMNEVNEKGCLCEFHIDFNCAAVYDWCRKTGRMQRPSQKAIDYAISRLRNEKRHKKISEKRLHERAKRILLEEYFVSIMPD